MMLVAFVIILGGFVIIYRTTITNRQIGKNNTAYVRVQNCILGIPPASRSLEEIDHCYTVIEKEFDTQLVRYDKM
jgi:hypothetical protein